MANKLPVAVEKLRSKIVESDDLSRARFAEAVVLDERASKRREEGRELNRLALALREELIGILEEATNG